MNELFNMDNRLFRAIGKITDLVVINILTIVFSFPIFTMGASFTAMYSVLLKLEEDKESSIVKSFVKSFKENFKNSTIVFLIAAVVGVIYIVNINLIRQGIFEDNTTLMYIVIGVIFLIILTCVMELIYVFALLARYDSNLKTTVLNGIKLIIAFYPRSLCMVIICISPLALCMLSNYFFWLWFLYGFAFPGYVCAMLLNRIFEKVEEANKEN